MFQVITYTRSIDFQSKSESLTTKDVLLFTYEVIVKQRKVYVKKLYSPAIKLVCIYKIKTDADFKRLSMLFGKDNRQNFKINVNHNTRN